MITGPGRSGTGSASNREMLTDWLRSAAWATARVRKSLQEEWAARESAGPPGLDRAIAFGRRVAGRVRRRIGR